MTGVLVVESSVSGSGAACVVHINLLVDDWGIGCGVQCEWQWGSLRCPYQSAGG